jgi:hypothetical protein
VGFPERAPPGRPGRVTVEKGIYPDSVSRNISTPDVLVLGRLDGTSLGLLLLTALSGLGLSLRLWFRNRVGRKGRRRRHPG